MEKDKDRQFGFIAEYEKHNYLEKFFGKLKLTKEKYGRYFEFDKYNDKYFIELKTRKINHNQYSTLFFGKNKYLKGKELLEANPDLRIFYIWNCLDGLYYWEHDSSKYTEKISGRRDRGKIEENMCIHILQKDIHNIREFIDPLVENIA